MKITFELVKGRHNKEVWILNDKKIIGRIVTPSDTSRDITNAIQICGFDDAFNFWGCGLFSDGYNNPKKDIQLLFNENSRERGTANFYATDMCSKCFHLKKNCRCSDLRVKTKKEIIAEKI